MGNNFEKIFKEKFDSFEAEYDQSAWDALEKRLNNSTQGGSGSSLMYWAAALLGVVAVSSALIYFYSEEASTDSNLSVQKSDKIVEPEEEKAVLQLDEEVVTQDKIAETNTETVSTKDVSTDDLTQSIVSPNKTTTPQKQNLEINSKQQHAKVDKIEQQSTDDKATPAVDTTHEDKVKSITLPTTNEIENAPKKTAKRRFISGIVEQHTSEENIIHLCAGEPLVVKNPSKDQETVRVAYDNQEIDIPAGQFTQLSLTNSSTISFLNEDNEVIHQQNVSISAKPQIDFTYEANIFDDGLPVVRLESYGSYQNTTWMINGEQQLNSTNPTVHLFNKGEYEVTLKVTDDNGCSTKKVRTVKIEKDYNLMAVSAFRPNDPDPRNRTFMPFSLTQRPVQFVLTIIDPKDNGIVFTSKDPSQPWDGTDQRTGKMTPPEKTYMWKVQLENPLPNERAVYVGTIVHH